MASDHGDVSPGESPTKAPGGEAGRLWDPLGAWPVGRRWLWAVLASLVCSLQGPAFIRSLRPPPDQGVDFFQSWASARNLFYGLPVYENLTAMSERHLGYRPSEVELMFEKSSQTPTAVLLASPFAWLSYPNATLAWNLVSLAVFGISLWLVARQLRIPIEARSVFPTLALLLICNPFRQQVNQGQLNMVLLLLVTGVWGLERSGRQYIAGTLLGVAMAIKLFPGLLILYFVFRRQWRIVIGAGTAFAATVTLTTAVVGLQTYRKHLEEGLPYLWQFRAEWANASLAGFWSRLFDAGAGFYSRRVELVWRSPGLARAGTFVSCALLLLIWARVVWRSRSRAECDQAFALGLTAMLLVSPITWDHYFLLLLLPLVLFWRALPPSDLAKALFLIILLGLWINTVHIAEFFIQEIGEIPRRVAGPLQTVSLLSFPCYALVGLFAFGVWLGRKTGVSCSSLD